METVARNAEQALAQHKLKRAADLTTRGKALEEIAEALGMDQAPLRIECFDVSQIQGTDVVASMVVFEDGLARKQRIPAVHRPRRHRRLSRRCPRCCAAGSPATSTRPSRARWPASERPAEGDEPDPTATPGHRPADRAAAQVRVPAAVASSSTAAHRRCSAAAQVLADLGIDDIAVCGLAKRLEEVWLPGDEFPVILPRTSEALYLLQRVRDEAHRFAITFHRERRSKRMTASTLDGVPGLGEIRRKALLRRFGSLKRLAAATVEEIASVPGIGRRTAEAIVAAPCNGPAEPEAPRPAAPHPAGDDVPGAATPATQRPARRRSDRRRADDADAEDAAST